MKGFTLIELLLSIAAIGIIAGISLPVFYGFQARHDMDLAAQSISTSLRRAQLLAQGMESNSPWGVRVVTSSIILFHGSNFSSRNIALDETFAKPETIAAGGVVEFVFEKFTGFPATTGTTTLTSSINGEARTIGVNARGMVLY